MKEVEIYTDGACSGNPGPGGYGVVLKYGENIKYLSGAYKNTTNNRMELRGVIVGLEALKEPCNVSLVSDSKYIIDAIEKGWVYRWQKNNWMRNSKESALNIDLWKMILDLMQKHKVKYIWVKGHAGHPMNEICDKMAVDAIKKGEFVGDEGVV